jgi:hypothetical protein
MRVRPVFLSCLAGLQAGCFDDVVAANAAIACRGDADCPTPLVCASLISRCVAPTGDRTAPVVVSSTLSARRLGAGGILDVALVTDEPILVGSLLQVGEVTTALVIDDDGRGGRASVAADALGGEGAFPVSVGLVDDAGNLGAAVLGVLEVDTTGPGLDADSVVVVVEQPAGTTPVAPPPLAPGGRIDVRFRIDDLAADVRRVALVGDAGADDDIVLELADHVATDWHFDLAFNAAVTDGPRTLIVEAVDDVGNATSTTLAVIEVVGSIGARCVALDATGAPLCTDADGDGFFGVGEECAVGQATDCDDTRALVFPGAVEVAGDDVDDDCDGTALTFADAEAAGEAIFVAPGAATDAAGTRADPLGDFAVAAARAAATGATLYVAGGTFVLPDARLTLYGSVVGSLTADWLPGGARTVLQATDPLALDAADAPADPLLLRGFDLRGTFCDGVAGPPGPLHVGDVDIENTPGASCFQGHGVRVDGDLLLVDGRLHLRFPEVNIVRGILARNEVRVLDSVIEVDGEFRDALGVSGATTGLMARSRVSVRGYEPAAVSSDLNVVSSLLQVDAVTTEQIFFGAVGLFGDGVMAHNRIEVVGAPDARVVGISSNAGVLIANDIIVRGSDAVGIRLENFIPPTAALHHNRLAVDGDGCRLAIGRVGDVCLDLAACSECSASVGNVEAPATPAPVSAIALGAPTTVAVDLDGACRAATSGVGASVSAP